MDSVICLKNMTYKFIKENYNYLWLKTRLKLAASGDYDTLVIGPSYALSGLDLSLYTNVVNCSMHSQDLIRDLLCIEKAINNNDRIKKCYVLLGYYAAFQNLEYETVFGKKMMETVYNIIFSEMGEDKEIYFPVLWKDMPEYEYSSKEVYSEAFKYMELQKNYYSDLHWRTPFFNFNGIAWRNLSQDVKNEFGDKRATSHNKSIMHREAYKLNDMTIKKMIGLFRKHHIEHHFIIPPFSKSYSSKISSELKEAIKLIVNDNGGRLIDFNLTSYFNDDDFCDTDHFNGRGAYKFSEILFNNY